MLPRVALEYGQTSCAFLSSASVFSLSCPSIVPSNTTPILKPLSCGIIEYNKEEKPGVSNLLTIYSVITGETISTIEEKYVGKGYGDFKTDLAELVVAELEPIQERYYAYLKSEELDTILDAGAEKAARVANKTLKKMENGVGLGRKRRR
ncbi:Tryptophan--tRNA ligase [Listeria monocytogenes]|nr:Tryptophan--tRNA ligase [Listeria monocytogenes]